MPDMTLVLLLTVYVECWGSPEQGVHDVQGQLNNGPLTQVLKGGRGPAQLAGHNAGMGQDSDAPTPGLMVHNRQQQQLSMAALPGQPTCLHCVGFAAPAAHDCCAISARSRTGWHQQGHCSMP